MALFRVRLAAGMGSLGRTCASPASGLGRRQWRPAAAVTRGSRQRCSAQCGGELPPELQDLVITDEGLLMDQKTGEVINQFGATRFDVAVRALRGEFDPPAWKDNTERTPGLLLDSLMQFPGQYTFSLVLKAQGVPQEQVLAEVAALVARVCQADVQLEQCTAKQRLGGKYVSLSIPVVVRAPEIVQQVFDELGRDPRVLMKY